MTPVLLHTACFSVKDILKVETPVHGFFQEMHCILVALRQSCKQSWSEVKFAHLRQPGIINSRQK